MVEAIVRDGNPKKAIVATATDWSADLIVMGLEGHSGIAGLLLGNTAQTVMITPAARLRSYPAKSLVTRNLHE